MLRIQRLVRAALLLSIAITFAGCTIVYPGAPPRHVPVPADPTSGSIDLEQAAAMADLTPAPGLPSLALTPSLPQVESLDTTEQQVLVLRPTGIYASPVSLSPLVEVAAPGAILRVLAASADGQWWEVECPTARFVCWITANPVFVQPIDDPVLPSTLTPTPGTVPPQVLNFVNGVAQVQGTTGFNQPQTYLFFGAQGQNIRVQLSSQPAGANFEVASQDTGIVYKSFGDPALDWSYVLPASQNYRVTANSVTPSVFTLTVTLGGGGAQRINVAPGQTTAQVSGIAGSGQSPQYVLPGIAGQQVRIDVLSPGNVANFSVAGVTDGVTYKTPTDPTRDWTFTLPTSQDYQITVSAASTVNFTLQFYLLTGLQDPVERINFAPGQSTQVVSGNLQGNVPKYYVVFVSAGQQLRLLLTSNPPGSANFAINGVSDGIVYRQLTDPSRETTITAPTSQDYLITVFSSVSASYQLEVTLPTPLPPTFQPTFTPLPTLQSGSPFPPSTSFTLCCLLDRPEWRILCPKVNQCK